MKESKVQLYSEALAKTNNQHYSVTNQYLDLLEEQKTVHLRLMDRFSQLDKSCQTILEDIHKQKTVFDTQTKSQRNNYLQLRSILIEATRSYEAYLNKQERSIRAINEHLTQQIRFNELTIERTNSQDKALNQLQISINRQKNFLNNFAIKQRYYNETVLDQLEKSDLYYTQSIEKQNAFEQMNETILANMQIQLAKQEEVYKRLQSSLDIQKNFLRNLSIKHNHQYEHIWKHLEAYSEYVKKTAETKDELKQMSEKILKNMNVLERQQEAAFHEVNKLLRNVIDKKEAITKILTALPPNYPIKQVITGGISIPVEKLLLVNEKKGIAYFSNGIGTITISIGKLDAIQWE